ncbi:MAG TPA: aminoacetone oxidase family FAD-binding enzyme [bacterium]|nr:aminoacetone oxidase family FAD-binding enzyme [bacterium]
MADAKHKRRVAVIGAGAAGTMAAIFAAEAGGDVTLLERTADGGRKILLSGGGHCNVLPSALDPARYVTDSSPNTLKKILRSWPLAEQRRFFEQTLGVPLMCEAETGKLFPASNQARDVRDALQAQARKLGVRFRFDATVRELRRADDGARWDIHLKDGALVTADAVVLATGGLSATATGCDGSGLRLARALGHVVHETYPALTPLLAEPPVHAALAGISLPVTLSATVAGRRVAASGAFLFTHKGYSGPAVLDLAYVAVRAQLRGEAQPIFVQWTSLDEATWEQRLRQSENVQVATVLRRELPARLAAALQAEAGVAADCRLAQLRRDERRALVEALTRYRLPWTGHAGYRHAEVTGGGVDLAEVDALTLESKRQRGLFFCGEMLDAWGPIGGYNFAWAWTTGRAAGRGASQSN